MARRHGTSTLTSENNTAVMSGGDNHGLYMTVVPPLSLPFSLFSPLSLSLSLSFSSFPSLHVSLCVSLSLSTSLRLSLSLSPFLSLSVLIVLESSPSLLFVVPSVSQFVRSELKLFVNTTLAIKTCPSQCSVSLEDPPYPSAAVFTPCLPDRKSVV